MKTEIEVKIPVLDHLAEAAKNLLQSVVAPPLEEVGLLLADKVRLYRFKNQVQILAKTEDYLKRKKMSTRKVSLKVLAPLLDECSLEEDESLQERWAALLGNTVAEGSRLDTTLYSHILSQLTKSDADLFQLIYEHSTKVAKAPQAIITIKQPTTMRLAGLPKTFPDLDLHVDNLIRLRLIKEDNPFSNETVNVSLTNLGFRFMQVCSFIE